MIHGSHQHESRVGNVDLSSAINDRRGVSNADGVEFELIGRLGRWPEQRGDVGV